MNGLLTSEWYIAIEPYLDFIYPLLLGFIAFIIRVAFLKRSFRFFAFLVDLFSTVSIGYIAYLSTEFDALTKRVRWGIVFVSALIGPELIAGVLQIAAIFSRSPVTFIMRIIRAITGNPFTSEEAQQMTEWERSMMEEHRRLEKRNGKKPNK